MGIRYKNKPGDQVRSRVFDVLNGRRNAIAKDLAMAASGREIIASTLQQTVWMIGSLMAALLLQNSQFFLPIPTKYETKPMNL
jgi:hypothetical protein